MPKTFLTAEWKNLVMANYVVDEKLLIPHLPHKTVLDVFEGKIFVSLVGFLFAETKISGIKIPFHINFEEVNLRFYVKYKNGNEWKRGVTFIKEIVPKPAISFIANKIYKEKYCTMPMKHLHCVEEDGLKAEYHWKFKNKWNKLSAITEINAVPMKEGSEENFILEHYWGYSKHSDFKTCEYGVEHPQWSIHPVKSYAVDCDFGGIYGKEFEYLKNETPHSVFMAQGSVVKVLSKRHL